MRALASVVFLALVAPCGCASTGTPTPQRPAPAEIAALEARALHDSTNTEAQLRLALAYRGQGRLRDALPVAERALQRSPDNARAALLVALTHEELGDYPNARAVYERAIRTSGSPRLRAQLESRLVLLQRRENEQFVKRTLAQETELAATPPRPRTLAVYPFGVAGADSTLAPMARALTAMLITDLSQTDRLTVLDRVVVQRLIDEMRLGESGYVDQATAARGGRLLGAERMVHGSVASDEQLVRLEAAVISPVRATPPPPAVTAPAPAPDARGPQPRPARKTPPKPLPGQKAAPPARPAQPPPSPTLPAQNAAAPPQIQVAPVAEADRLERLFDMEKRLALKLYSALGVELTPAERAEVTKRRTENLQALLAFGRGLQAQDRGDMDAALRFFAQASRLDPGFAPAAQELSATRAIATAERSSTEQLATQVAPQSAAVTAMPPLAAPAGGAVQRDPIAEVLGTEGTLTRTILELVIRRPGGAP